MAYVAGARADGGEPRGLVLFAARRPRTALLLLACFAVVAPFVALVLALPCMEPSLTRGYAGTSRATRRFPRPPLGLAAGVREEFYFRSYLLGRMGELGLPVPVAAIISTLLFSLGHLYEGVLGFAIAAVLGTILCIAYLRKPNLHVIAIAHGMYNAIVLCLSIPLSRALPATNANGIFS